MAKFSGLNVQVLGISIDHIHTNSAWAEHLGGITYPLLSDFWPHGKVAKEYGVLRPEGRSERALFLIDVNGIIQYVDVHDIDEQPPNEEIFAEIAKLNPEGAKALAKQEPEEVILPSGGVIMYCNTWCPDCKKARSWLKEHDIAYTEVDIPSTPGAADQVREWTGGDLITPTFNIEGKIIVDFKQEELAKTLKV